MKKKGKDELNMATMFGKLFFIKHYFVGILKMETETEKFPKSYDFCQNTFPCEPIIGFSCKLQKHK